MTLHLCLDCATIWDCPQGVEKVCRKCGQALSDTREHDRPDKAESLSTLASWALFGLREKERE